MGSVSSKRASMIGEVEAAAKGWEMTREKLYTRRWIGPAAAGAMLDNRGFAA